MQRHPYPASPLTGRLAAALAIAAFGLPLAAMTVVTSNPCTRTASDAFKSCGFEAKAEFWKERGKCANLTNAAERAECTQEAFASLGEALDLCEDQYEARRDLCAGIGGGAYDPEIEPEDFVAVVDNPFLPRIPGMQFLYRKVTAEGIETGEITVTHQTKVILGVTCTVLRSIERLDGIVKEDTDDWIAQDEDGNVWYFGELAQNFENGELVNLDGSWQAGVDGAKPGILMRAAPQVGDLYRQEFLLQEAEDVAGVLSHSASVAVPYGSFTNCLKTEEYTPLEPDVLEHKFYYPGVGFLLSINVGTGARTELVSFTVN